MGDTNKPSGSADCQPGKADVREHYERHLPHQTPPGFPIFLTWNLKGSLPKHVIATLEQERERLHKEPQRPDESEKQRGIRHDKLLFAKRDSYLDTARIGPMDLQQHQAAKIVVDSILWGVSERYELYAYVVMANHVHTLLMPKVDLQVITQGMKGYTSYQINAIQNQHGRILWQDESYDHWARDEEEMIRIIDYIEFKPVKAGLCKNPEDWFWSSAAIRKKLNWLAGAKFQPEWKTILSTSGFPA